MWVVSYAVLLKRRPGSGLEKKRSAEILNGKTFENGRRNGLESTRTGWFRCLPGLGTCGDDHGDDGTKVDLGGMEGIYYLNLGVVVRGRGLGRLGPLVVIDGLF